MNISEHKNIQAMKAGLPKGKIDAVNPKREQILLTIIDIARNL